MKKFSAAILVLILCLMFVVSAVAEQKTFALTTVTTLEGEIIATINEEGVAIDADGNDVSAQFPAGTITIDDEALTFQLANASNEASGSVEIVEAADDAITLTLNADYAAITAVCVIDNDSYILTLVDEASGILLIMPEIEA